MAFQTHRFSSSCIEISSIIRTWSLEKNFQVFLCPRFAWDHAKVAVVQIELDQGLVSQKSRKRFGPGKSIIKLRPACSVKLVFSYVVKLIQFKINAKSRASRCLCFEDTKRITSLEIRPKSLGTFEKRAQSLILIKRANLRVLRVGSTA